MTKAHEDDEETRRQQVIGGAEPRAPPCWMEEVRAVSGREEGGTADMKQYLCFQA